MRKLLLAAGGLILAFTGFILVARLTVSPVSDEQLRARYMTGASTILTIDGVPLHFSDEGAGPPLILLHGSYGSLRMWDDWAAALKDQYRIIRFDIPPVGLSGPDPSGEYGYDRAQELLGLLADKLGLDDFYLAGTSIGGAVAYRYAAEHPSRVKRLIVAEAPMVPLNSPVARGAPRSFQLTAAMWFSQTFLGGLKTTYERRLFLEHLFVDDAKITSAMVKEYRDYANRDNNTQYGMTFARNSRTTVQTAQILASLTMPTLVMWCDGSPVLPVAHAEAALKHFEGVEPQFIVVPGCGHILPLEAGTETATIAKTFLMGDS